MGIMLLLNDVLDHEKAFNEYLHYTSTGDHKRAAEAGRALLSGIQKTLERIQQDYPALVIDSRMPDFAETRAVLEKTSFADKELAGLASKLESYVSVIEREVNGYRRKEAPKWIRAVSERRRQIAMGVAAAAGVCLLAWGALKIIRHGQGLAGEYYGDIQMGVFYKSRIDRMIDFTWGRGGPFGGWKRDHFSVRWNGFLLIPETGFYDIYVHSDDGARFYLDHKLVLDSWVVQKLRVMQVSQQLEAGYHPIRLDYFERTKMATVRLFWKIPGTPRPVPIDGRFLCPSEDYFKEGVPVHAVMVPAEDDEEISDAPPAQTNPPAPTNPPAQKAE